MNRRERRAAAKAGQSPYAGDDAAHSNAALFANAVKLHQAGQLQRAHEFCQRILAADPNDWNALHLAGLISHQIGRNDMAIDLLRRAVALNDKIPPLHNTIGDVLRGLGRFDEAVGHYRRALSLAPNFAPAHNNLGYALFLQGKPEEAIAAFRRAVALAPDNALAHNNLGAALTSQGRYDEAITAGARAVVLRADYVEAHNNLGNAYRERGELGRAAACYRQALAYRPDYATGHNNLGIVLKDCGELDAAIASFCQAIKLAPGYAEAHNNLGSVLRIKGELDQAVACHRQALALDPSNAAAHNNLGVALREQGEIELAVAAYRQALALNPNLPDTLGNLGIALREHGLLGEAIAALRAALTLRPGLSIAEAELIYAQALACDWNDAENWLQRLLAAAARQTQTVPPFILLTQAATSADQLFCAQRWLGEATVPSAARLPHPPRPRRDKLRLAYLSEDFRDDVVGTLIPELIERHDRARFEVVAYCYGREDHGRMRNRLRAAFDQFVDIRPSAIADAARRIHEGGTDILVDLVGYTHRTRSQILAHRPAPIQVSYLGYPGTMGADFIDYIIVDSHIVPPDRQPFYAERLVHLPDCYQPSDTSRALAEPLPSRAACGLPVQGFVFCCFNNGYKITPVFFDIWMRLLRQVPGSVLWLLESDALVVENLQREAVVRGVAPERLVFAGRAPMRAYLARLRIADLFVDTLPYNAGATANDALWAGLPLLTCSGDTYVGRMAGSLLRAIGLPELIAGSLVEYEALALRLATEPSRLADLRRKLADNRSTAPLFDMARYTRHLEAAYSHMGEVWRRGEAPSAFAVPQSTSI